MRANGSSLRIPYIGEISTGAISEAAHCGERPRKTCSGPLIAALILAGALLLLGIVSLRLVSAGTEIQNSRAPIAESVSDVPVVYEHDMIYQEGDLIHYVR